MEHRAHLAKLNLVPGGTETGAASSRIKIFSAVEWEDNFRFWNAYVGCDLAALYRLEVDMKWFWPRPGDNRFAFLSEAELWAKIGQLLGEELGIPCPPPPRPKTFAVGEWVRYMDPRQYRTRSRVMTEPVLENGVWWVRLMGERLLVPCNALAE